jgi:predicted metalloprotease with PDZ domain
MFGWNEATAPTAANLQSLLAHEMTHNWPAMEGEHGETAWYSEGAAEFYSLVLSTRAGVFSTEEFRTEINERASGYYTNPYRNASNAAAAEQFWKDWAAQRVPYGRGFMYLAQVDAKIRALSGNKRSLDDLVTAMFDRQRSGKPYGIPQWLGLVAAELGSATAQQDFAAMKNGEVIVPPTNSFAPCFRPMPHKDRPYQLGFDQASLSTEPKVIRGLVATSAAATAGLRDGDVVVTSDDVLQVQKDASQTMHLSVKRDETVVPIAYVPRGEPIDSFHWERVPGTKDSQCRF